MPVYEYLCGDCGPFTENRPMAEYEDPQPCPGCSASAPRVLLTAPRLATLSSDRRQAYATNERSSNAPQFSSDAGGSHNAGCSCCSGAPSRFASRGKKAAKSFPAKRPWMISH